ncbi:hypothetical protein TNCV_1299781 [Trichonephila clavipes]|nr:hypothetical protein TNCV_1299781 [Trichonephila clavipes]
MRARVLLLTFSLYGARSSEYELQHKELDSAMLLRAGQFILPRRRHFEMSIEQLATDAVTRLVLKSKQCTYHFI